MLCITRCNRCGKTFRWYRTFEARWAVRRTCSTCLSLEDSSDRRPGRPTSTFSHFGRVKAEGTRIQAPFEDDTLEHLSEGPEIMVASPVRSPGCPGCCHPYSACVCRVKGESNG